MVESVAKAATSAASAVQAAVAGSSVIEEVPSVAAEAATTAEGD